MVDLAQNTNQLTNRVLMNWLGVKRNDKLAFQKILSIEELETLFVGMKPRIYQHCLSLARETQRKVMILVDSLPTLGHWQSKHQNCCKGSSRKTPEKQSRKHTGFHQCLNVQTGRGKAVFWQIKVGMFCFIFYVSLSNSRTNKPSNWIAYLHGINGINILYNTSL